MFRFSVETITFVDGTEVPLLAGDILAVVGPNNAGKTSCLREIVAHGRDGADGVLVSAVKLDKAAPEIEVLEWLRQHLHRAPEGDRHRLAGWGGHMAETTVVGLWKSPRLSDLASFLFRLATTEDRLKVAKATERHSFGAEPPHHPMQVLDERRELEVPIAAAFRIAFGEELFLDRAAGRQVVFRVGPKPTSEFGYPLYREELTRTQNLESQGDGMRSFVGSLLELMATPHPVVLIDEPEAFLHSPQALQLGKTLGRGVPAGRQLVIATHSAELLRGLLDANPEKVRVVRVRRRDTTSMVGQIDPAAVKELWSDPFLRASNVFDGLFHEAVVVCEGASDARFYAAVIDAISDSQPELRRPDVMFIHAGGKDGMAKVARALGSVGVPVRIIADFDLLRDEQAVVKLLQAGGGTWSDSCARDWRIVNSAIQQKSQPIEVADVRKRIATALEGETGKYLSREAGGEIKKAVTPLSGWREAQRAGVMALPGGDAVTAYKRLSAALAACGIFVVPVGELERFVPSISDGPSWVNTAIEHVIKGDPDVRSALEFVGTIIGSLA